MSMIYKGAIVESELSANSNGGTEMMRARLLERAEPELLEKVAVHFSRPREIPKDVEKVAYEVLRHRIILSYRAQAEGVTSEKVIDEIFRPLFAKHGSKQPGSWISIRRVRIIRCLPFEHMLNIL